MSATPTDPLLVVVANTTIGERLGAALGGLAGCEVRSVVGAGAAVEALRSDRYAAVIATVTPDGIDALALIHAMRASGDETAVVVLGERPTAESEEAVYDAGGDGYRVAAQTSPACLLAAALRAAETRALDRENRRLRSAEERRLRDERDDADRLLSDQRALIGELEGLPEPSAAGAAVSAASRDESLAERYESLLRAYVVMGVGSLADDIGRLAERLVAERWGGPRVMELHLQVVGRLVEGVGSRGGRHVLARADLLALEVMVHLAEAYRRSYVAAGADAALRDPGRGAEPESEEARRRLAPWVDRFAA